MAKIASKKRRNDVFPVRTLDFQISIRDFNKKRTEEWSDNVLGRLEYAEDISATTCSMHFRTGRRLPVKYRPLKQKYRY